ncbi:electron transfer flavoprotein subunit beta [Methanosarcinales archaeon]|uniref:Electron transfer flavoprotein, beta subunit n=1 Tax=Candidatus Syntropharchaeum caldarium TaxID=1838285 RepID=A0A1F2P915_9EURY|nr:MAG: Electron transfer flavoprotein, beta subunit [Candidatus Syntrophoarchaeum caldarius]RLG31727.1 MAG: electron transfer flavoprotein subunit beta [Methanosarcinales archaeon]
MEIVVCVKRVPDTSEADVVITGKDIKKDDLAFEINEWDNYAVEEAVQIKEKLGGNITVISIGDEGAKEVIRRGLAMGGDTGIRIDHPALAGSDSMAIAKTLAAAIKDIDYDLVLTGAQAGDLGAGIVPVALAEMLGVPHATLAVGLDIEDGKAKVKRELEGGLMEVLEMDLPAVVGVQTGINEPRYVSIMGIRKASKKEIKLLDISDLGLLPKDVGEEGSLTVIEELSVPPVTKVAEILEGDPAEAASKLAEIMKEKGVL